MNPFSLSGPEFLALWVAGALAVAVASLVIRRLVGGPRATPAELDALATRMSPSDLAYLAGGLERAIEAAVAGLLHDGTLGIADRGLHLLDPEPRMQPDGVYRGTAAPDTQPLVERHVLDHVRREPGISVSDLIQRAAALDAQLAGRAEHERLRFPPRLDARAAIYFPGALWLALGAAKLLVGLGRGRPVTLLLLLLVGGIFALTRLRLPRLTTRGQQLLHLLDERSQGLAITARTAPQQLSGPDLTLAYALFGVATTGATIADLMPSHHRIEAAASSSSGSGSSCGSSCGSGCGGGCGGCS